MNKEQQPEEIEGIHVTSKIKYLGVTISNTRNCFKEHKEMMIKKARRFANTTYSIISKSCNKMLIGKTFWKSLALPSIMYGIDIMELTKTELRTLQTIEHGVYRQILGAPKYAPISTLRGEIGASSMEARIMKGRMLLLKSILVGKNDLLKETVKDLNISRVSEWAETNRKFKRKLEITDEDLRELSTKAIKKKVQEWDNKMWKEEMESKTSIEIYRAARQTMGQQDQIYDNKPSSITLFKCRTNTLPLNDRKRFENKATNCELCCEINETLPHFLLFCPAYVNERQKIPELHQPYQEDIAGIIKSVLFENGTINNTKEIIHNFWKIRNRRIKAKQKEEPIPHPTTT